MSGSYEDREKLRRIKSQVIDSIIQEERNNRELAYYHRLKVSNIHFNNGIKWFQDGNKLEDSLDKDILSFRRGYEKAVNMYGTKLAMDGVPLSDIPPSFTEKNYFMDGYNKGLDLLEKQKNKKPRSR